VREGQSWSDPGRLGVASYKVSVERDGDGGRVQGAYKAESYPVSIEDGDVVVEMG
jgi:hypothetical protein